MAPNSGHAQTWGIGVSLVGLAGVGPTCGLQTLSLCTAAVHPTSGPWAVTVPALRQVLLLDGVGSAGCFPRRTQL
ncbi:hypothetical protein PAL_GLEAN10017219 [Pteropus alecto]|uniref:Secreted protein n=1 Tax=Pteropus alecto TaxID=9402 RepID=L5KHS9_PTEAL|nr:hypothetical protein PAL_GLEAN10017219 [Pteropus alecto]